RQQRFHLSIRDGRRTCRPGRSRHFRLEPHHRHRGHVLGHGPHRRFFPPCGNRIDLNSIDADETAPGYQGFTFIGDAAFSRPGEVRAVAASEARTFIVSLNTDSDREPEAAIRVTIGDYGPGITVTPAASWFVPWVAEHPL